ncbi:hypothetical protein SA6_12170, partial [Staphylococcus epidermidis]
PFVADREHPEAQAEHEGQQGPDRRIEVQPERGGIEQPRHHRDAGVELAAEQQRHLVAEDVAQHAAGAAGDHAGDDHDRQRGVDLPGYVAAGHGEHHEPDRIEHQEGEI